MQITKKKNESANFLKGHQPHIDNMFMQGRSITARSFIASENQSSISDQINPYEIVELVSSL